MSSRSCPCVCNPNAFDRVSYQVSEKPPSGSPENVKPRQVVQGTAAIVDGRPTPHVVAGLAPGKVGAAFSRWIAISAVSFCPLLLCVTWPV